MELNLLDGFEFYPSFNGNMQLPEKKRVVVKCNFVSFKEIRRIAAIKDREESQKEDFLSYCAEIKNLKINGKEVEPIDVYTMPGLTDLCTEITTKYLTASAVDKKK